MVYTAFECFSVRYALLSSQATPRSTNLAVWEIELDASPVSLGTVDLG